MSSYIKPKKIPKFWNYKNI